jgi:hypothetical protein
MSNFRAVVREARLADEAKNAKSSRRDLIRRIAAISPEAMLEALISNYLNVEPIISCAEIKDRRLKFDRLNRELQRLFDAEKKLAYGCDKRRRNDEREMQIFDEMDMLNGNNALPATPLSQKYQRLARIAARKALEAKQS